MFNIPDRVRFVNVPVEVHIYDTYPLDKVSNKTIRGVVKSYAHKKFGCNPCEVTYELDKDIPISENPISTAALSGKDKYVLSDVKYGKDDTSNYSNSFCVKYLHGKLITLYNSEHKVYGHACLVSDGKGNSLTYIAYKYKYYPMERELHGIDKEHSSEKLVILYRKNGGEEHIVRWRNKFYLGQTYTYKKGDKYCLALASASDVDRSWEHEFKSVFKDGIIPRGIEICSDGKGDVDITVYPYGWSGGLYTPFNVENCGDRVCVDVAKIAKTTIKFEH